MSRNGHLKMALQSHKSRREPKSLKSCWPIMPSTNKYGKIMQQICCEHREMGKARLVRTKARVLGLADTNTIHIHKCNLPWRFSFSAGGQKTFNMMKKNFFSAVCSSWKINCARPSPQTGRGRQSLKFYSGKVFTNAKLLLRIQPCMKVW